MANPTVFCNTPWYEAHVYWDGSLGICCQESRKLHTDDEKYNIRNMSLADWFNSEPVRQFRKDILGNDELDICKHCYHEAQHGGTSRRHRSNQKSVIFTKQAFLESFLQSPGYDHFKFSQGMDGLTNTLPIDLHIDLGNHCNLACKMCRSEASSTIAVQNVKWGTEEHRQYLGNDWTRDEHVWNRFLHELLNIPKIKNLHFMGGETLLTKKFEDLVDFFITHNRFDLCFSFVTNGTTFNESLINKLKKFTRVGIEVSIETATEHNSYVRQGTDTTVVLENIQKYITYCTNSSISVTVRPAISALTVGYYYTLLEYCLEHKLLVKSLIVTSPTWLDANILPDHVKQLYKIPYQKLLNKLDLVDTGADYNESDPNNYIHSIVMQAKQAIHILEQNNPVNQQQEWTNLIEHCRKWDSVYKLDGLSLYPELVEIFKKHGY